MRVLLTGVRGFSGRHMARRLSQERGVDVVGLDRAGTCPDGLDLEAYVSGDVSQPGTFDALFRQFTFDRVFHLAGRFAGSPGEMWRTNVLGTWRLLRALEAHQPRARVLLVGSAAEYGAVPLDEQPVAETRPCEPVNLYGRCKYRTTELGLEFAARGMHVTVARSFNLVGSGVPSSLVVGAIIQRAFTAMAEGRADVEVGNVHSVRDFVDVRDAVELYWLLSDVPEGGQVFNVCSGTPRTVESVLIECLGNADVPLRLAQTAALQRGQEVNALHGDPVKAERVTGMRPTSNLSKALREAWLAAARAQCG